MDTIKVTVTRDNALPNRYRCNVQVNDQIIIRSDCCYMDAERASAHGLVIAKRLTDGKPVYCGAASVAVDQMLANPVTTAQHLVDPGASGVTKA